MILDLKKRRARAESFFRHKWPRHADTHMSDFGAYCVERWLIGKDLKASYRNIGIDYLRIFGDRTGTRGSSDLMASMKTKRVKHLDSQHGKNSFELDRFHDAEALRDPRLPQQDRMVLILYFEWEFNLKEIGDLLGISESRSCQMLKKAMADQKERIKNG
jgi:hypothetical protein